MVAALDDSERDGTFDFARQTLGVLGGHDAILAAVHDVDRAGDPLGDAFERQRRGFAARLLQRSALAAHPECLLREARKAVPANPFPTRPSSDLLPFMM